MRVGTDIGGTFTDFVAVDDRGRATVLKVQSIPEAPQRAVVDAVPDLLVSSGIEPGDVAFFGHATTIATNSLLERKGANVALITTMGCRDVLEIGRLARPDDRLYDLHYRPRPPLVSRRRRFEVEERVDAAGRIVVPLDEGKVRSLADRLSRSTVEAVAVVFLFSYLNPAHEIRVREIITARAPRLDVSLSSEVAPSAGEYERTSSTVVNASIQRIMSNYLEALSFELKATGIDAALRVMQSAGGLSGVTGVLARPITTILSGPCSGAIAGRYSAARVGITEAINVDMGGTSCDVSLIVGGEVGKRDGQDLTGEVIRLPSVDLSTIGAGGGSIAWLDRAGILRVGPESAGARPGPVCYGRGGDRATVTDADLVLGILGEDSLHGAGLKLDAQAAVDVCSRLGAELGLDAASVAWGIRRIVNAAMTNEIRGVSIARGYDARDFALVAFGGAGPSHAAEIASDLHIDTVIVPANPGCHSAYGLAIADIVYEHVIGLERTGLHDVDRYSLRATIDELEARGMAQLDEDRIALERGIVHRALGLRYVGQEGTLVVPIAPEDLDGPDGPTKTLQSFHRIHRATYGFSSDDDPVEIVDARVTVMASSRPAGKEALARATADVDLDSARRGTRVCRFLQHEGTLTNVFQRELLSVGATIDGPAILEQLDATTVVPPAWCGTVLGSGDLVMKRLDGPADRASRS